jgi:helix-turn-helix protein
MSDARHDDSPNEPHDTTGANGANGANQPTPDQASTELPPLPEDVAEFRSWLLDCRRRLHLDQEAFANALAITRQYLNALERGRSKPPSLRRRREYESTLLAWLHARAARAGAGDAPSSTARAPGTQMPTTQSGGAAGPAYDHGTAIATGAHGTLLHGSQILIMAPTSEAAERMGLEFARLLFAGGPQAVAHAVGVKPPPAHAAQPTQPNPTPP